ncbi:MAG: cell division protein ZapA [Hyphomicrobiales bacterium]|nr:MAG: cell division protein ZapA [Hyphomicrobiales bacterium]
MAQVSVTINGKQYRMACDDGEEERLFGLARRFDGYVDELRGSFGEIGDQRLTVMAGIMALDQLVEAERKLRDLEAELQAMKETRTSIINRQEEAEKAIAERLDAAAGRITALAANLGKGEKPVAG